LYNLLKTKTDLKQLEAIAKKLAKQSSFSDIYLLNGNYIFKLKRKKNIHARFTFLINLLSDNPIKHHHSSRIINN